MTVHEVVWTESCHLNVSDIKKKQMSGQLRACEERDRALREAVEAARAKHSSPSQKPQLEKLIRKKEKEINQIFRKVMKDLKEQEAEGKALTAKQEARAAVDWPSKEEWYVWCTTEASHEETRTALRTLQEDWITAPCGHAGCSPQQSRHAAQNGNVYRIKAANKKGEGPCTIWTAEDQEEEDELPEGWTLVGEEEEETGVPGPATPTADVKWPRDLGKLLAKMKSKMRNELTCFPYSHSHSHMAESLENVLELDEDGRIKLAEKVDKSRHVNSSDFTAVYEAAKGPEGETAARNRIKWLLCALSEENVAASREEGTDCEEE